MRTIFYSVSTGYFARNLLRTGVIERLLALPDIRIVIISPGYDNENFVKEFSYSDRIFIEKMYPADRAYDFNDKIIWKAWMLGHKYCFFQVVYKVFLKMQIKTRYYDKYIRHYSGIFDKYAPCLVIGASPGINSRMDIPIFAIAQKRKIKTLALIHSWDNIAKRKGPMWIRPDVLGVWNELQKQDGIKANFYDQKDVRIVGPVHFDMYWKKETFRSKDKFFEEMGLDPAKKLISVIATAPGLVKNYYIVDILLEALKMDKFMVPVQLLCRPTPSIDPRRNDKEFGKYYNNPDIVMDTQVQYSSSLGWDPDKKQLSHFANLVKYTDVQVSIVSTATVEAVILDKPVVNVAFSTVEPDAFQKYIIDSVFSNHFQPVLDYRATYIAKNPDDLIHGINNYLRDSSIHCHERAELKKVLVYKADGNSVDRVSQLILELISQ